MDIEQLEEKIEQSDALMVYFSGEFCNVCKVLQPKIKDAFSKHYPKIEQLYISADNYKQTAAKFGVFALPTIIIYFDGKEQKRKSRNLSVDGLIEELKRPYTLFFD